MQIVRVKHFCHSKGRVDMRLDKCRILSEIRTDVYGSNINLLTRKSIDDNPKLLELLAVGTGKLIESNFLETAMQIPPTVFFPVPTVSRSFR